MARVSRVEGGATTTATQQTKRYGAQSWVRMMGLF